MDLGIGILIGITLVGVIRLLELRFNVSTDTVSHLRFTHRKKAELILPNTTPDDIADQIVKSQNSSTGINPLT